MTCDLACLVILLGKEHLSSNRCIKCKSPSKFWKLFNHSMDDEWTIETLKVMSQSGGNAECLGVKEEPYWDYVEVDNFICPILYNQINLGNSVFHNLSDYGKKILKSYQLKKIWLEILY